MATIPITAALRRSQGSAESIATYNTIIDRPEKSTNPFLRWDFPQIQSATNTRDPVQTFARLRGMKDQF